ncbi:zinc-dependent alcohol dehydrogenase family protein [Hymenobacter terrenus]|uniref:zinc-dependent alcohol dehydrogenase family protein n=1 Tax=Hymenobacter terrenus TaxID=1629124 RepID=UPI0006191A0D|nr:NAD(P)-dependent alcohol dehydrogenase [Hymenobacter terrenus]
MNVVEIGEGYGIDSLRMVQRAPEALAPNQIRVRVRAVSLNYRDLLVVNGFDRWKPPTGRIPVSDGAGEVVEVGAAVTRVQTGDRVAGLFLPNWISGRLVPEGLLRAPGGASFDGFLTEYAVLGEGDVIAVPAYLSYEEAATLPCAALTAWHGLIEEGTIKAGDTVLIQGTGGISLFSLQFALLSGAEVIVISSSDEKLSRVAQLGARHRINYVTTPDWPRQVLDLTNGRGVNHVVEVVGATNINKSIEAVAVAGTISLIGLIEGIKGEINTEKIMGKHIRLQGIEVGSTAMFQNLNRDIASAQLHPVIDRVFPFAEFKEAFTHLSEGRHFGKVCIAL